MATNKRDEDKQLEKMLSAACRKAGVPRKSIPAMMTVVQTILAGQKFDGLSLEILAEAHQMIADIVASFIKGCQDINNGLADIHDKALARNSSWEETRQKVPSKLTPALVEEARQVEAAQRPAASAGG